jgi:hypothetical protein
MQSDAHFGALNPEELKESKMLTTSEMPNDQNSTRLA